MTAEVDWPRKIQALLYPYPPDVAINPATRIERSRGYLERVGANASVPESILDAHEIAFALDIPAFIRQPDQNDVFQTNPCIIHPLSGDLEYLELKATKNLERGMSEVIKCFANLAADPRKQFLALWRFLPDVTREAAPEQWRPYWNLLPAEPAFPAHSVWEHTALASAVAGTWNPEHKCHDPALLMFTISSAQELLMSSRRTQDLWMGSYLLSWLTWKAIEVVASRIGPDSLIYPDLRGQPLLDYWLHSKVFSSQAQDQSWRDLAKKSIWDDRRRRLTPEMRVANLPNMFTALVPRTSAKAIAEDATKVVQAEWVIIANSVETRIEKGLPYLANDRVWQELWKEPVKSFVQDLGMFWVTYPLGSPSSGEPLSKLVQQAIKDCEEWIKPEKGKAVEERWENYKRLLRLSKDSLNVGMMYYPVSRLAARALTNRKSLRDFKQQSAPGEKCTLCGTRSALHPEGANKYHELRDFWRQLSRLDEHINDKTANSKLKLAGRIRKGDHLCASCLTRRLAWEQHFLAREFADLSLSDSKLVSEEHLLFPSTSSMATASFKQQILNKLEKGNSTPEESKRLEVAIRDYNEKVKRFLRDNDILYPSAAIPALAEVPGELARGLNLTDGEWLYDESFDVENICREYDLQRTELLNDAENLDKLNSAREAAATLRDTAKEIIGITPSRYYAIVAMDGDNMGQWVSGQKSPDFIKLLHPDVRSNLVQNEEARNVFNSRRPLGPTLHMALSNSLKNFSLKCVRPVLEAKRAGRLIYAGGDDVLALVPVADVLGVLRSLRYLFGGVAVNADFAPGISEVRNGFATVTDQHGNKTRLRMMGPSATISAGVAIVHHKHPFSHAVEMAHKALKQDAKERLGRDAFAIRLFKRSGEPVSVGSKWTYTINDHEAYDQIDTINQITGAMHKDVLSPIIARDILRETAGMRRCSNEAQQAELTRLVARHAEGAANREHVGGLLRNLLNSLSQGMSDDDPWQQLANTILLARFLANEAYHE